MATAGPKKKKVTSVAPRLEEAIFKFDSPSASGVLKCEREEYGLRIECDGKPLLFIDLYYRSKEGAADSPLNHGRVHVQVEHPLPGELGLDDDAWLHIYMGEAGIRMARGSALQDWLDLAVPYGGQDVVVAGEAQEPT